jgi:hypothetical protein
MDESPRHSRIAISVSNGGGVSGKNGDSNHSSMRIN